MTYETIYREARKNGDCSHATKAVRAAGLGFAQACDLCWMIEAGKPTPAWAHGDGRTTTQSEDAARAEYENKM